MENHRKNITKRAKDARTKIEGGKKIKHRRVNDNTSCVYSIHIFASRSMRVRKLTMPKNTTPIAWHIPITLVNINLAE